ncbi:MAG TPA: pyridoxal phosphate-dependent aminotransferase [Thermoplasmata archaeon]|nr:pyridoxal phosphate-dependent aminotransferase [Thermoplasmata archaeon]
MAAASFDAFRYAHDHRNEIAWMSQNTNHLVPTAVVQDAILAAVRERRYEGYPYAPGDPELRSLVLADLGFAPETGLVVSAGGTEALYMLTRALLGAGDEVIASDPSYLIIHRFVELSGAHTVNLDIYAAPYRLTADRVQEAITDRTRMILLIDPLNPLGSGYPAEEVRAIAEIAHDRHLVLLNDVTYRDFADHPTLAATIAPEETLTVWSVSKNCGLAGLRLGGLAGPKDLVQKVARYNTNDLGVNVLAQAAATGALRTKPTWIGHVRSTTRDNQRRIRDAVARVPGAFLPVYPSQANMFVIDLSATGVTPEALQKELLLRHGVFIRAGNYLSPKFGGRFVRASFSNPPADIDRFVAAFGPCLESLRPNGTAAAPQSASPTLTSTT